MRILTLTPAATEIICALGFEDQLVGRSHDCDYPPSVVTIPALTAPKLTPDSNDAPFALLTHLCSVYLVDVDAVQQIEPDVIVTTVKAGSYDAVREALDALFENPPLLINLVQSEIADVLASFTRISGLLGVPERGAALMLQVEAHLKDINTRAFDIQPKPTVAAIQWIEPLMICGNWIPELITLAGGTTLFGHEGKPSFEIEWDDLWAADPDRIVIMACNLSIEETAALMPELTRQHGWATLRAIRDKQVYITDANQFFSRPSPRLAESLEILAEILHPDAFHFGHESTGWQKL